MHRFSYPSDHDISSQRMFSVICFSLVNSPTNPSTYCWLLLVMKSSRRVRGWVDCRETNFKVLYLVTLWELPSGIQASWPRTKRGAMIATQFQLCWCWTHASECWTHHVACWTLVGRPPPHRAAPARGPCAAAPASPARNPGDFIRKVFNLKKSGNEVYNIASSVLAILKNSCSKLHCQKF